MLEPDRRDDMLCSERVLGEVDIRDSEVEEGADKARVEG
jgi:hypothetical protein